MDETRARIICMKEDSGGDYAEIVVLSRVGPSASDLAIVLCNYLNTQRPEYRWVPYPDEEDEL